MDNLVSKIPKEKLKVGKLYKTKLPNVGQPSFRVWMGHGWSIGTQKPRNKEWPIYFTKAGESIQEFIIVVNTRATPFKPTQATTIQPPHYSEWFNTSSASSTNSFSSKKTPIRYLNRP